jgi:Ser/Thr protein kinase RdoA (MazF antagonist)
MIYKKITKNQEKSLIKVLKHYFNDTSKIHIFLNTIANNNRIFLIKTSKNKFILRESNKTKSLDHLQLEVDILQHLNRKGFKLTPHIIPNIKGSFITHHNNKYYLLENFLPGIVKKSVNNLTNFNNQKLISLFTSLARFSKTIESFKSPPQKNNHPIAYYVKNCKALIETSLKQVRNKKIQDLLLENTNYIYAFTNETEKQLKQSQYPKLKKQIVHFDLHPGNVNYLGDKITGIFDFDWVRCDNRLVDLACSLGQSCYSYRGKNRALYDKRKIQAGISAYNRAYGKNEFSLKQEKQIIKVLLRSYMIFQLLWIIEWHIENPKDEKGFENINFSIDVLKLNDFESLIS